MLCIDAPAILPMHGSMAPLWRFLDRSTSIGSMHDYLISDTCDYRVGESVNGSGQSGWNKIVTNRSSLGFRNWCYIED